MGLQSSGHGGIEQPHEKVPDPRLDLLNPAEIDRADELFMMSFEPHLGPLRESVKQVGILEPIWLRERGRKFQIINGFRRYDVARELRTGKITALIWREDEIDDRHAFQMSLHGNMPGRGLNLVEKGLVLEKLLHRFSVSRIEVIHTYLPLLNLEPSETVLNSFLTVNRLSKDLKRYIVSHRLSLNNVLLLARFSSEDQESICGFLSPLKVGENVHREILTFLGEISQRDGIGISDLLSRRELQNVLIDTRRSGPQKIQGIRNFLREKRYPKLSELEERFRSHKKKMRLSPQVAIRPPPFFEGDQLKVEFSFRSLQQYEALLGELQNLSKQNIEDLLTIKGYGTDTV